MAVLKNPFGFSQVVSSKKAVFQAFFETLIRTLFLKTTLTKPNDRFGEAQAAR
jgi:hypothetical protein